MDVPFLLSEAQMRRIEPFFPLSHGIPRVDDQRIVSGMRVSPMSSVRPAAGEPPSASCGQACSSN